MNTKEYLISCLASFLRLHGESVIRRSSKLSLTTSALCLLNAVFIDILLHDRIEGENTNENHALQTFLDNVQYLQDFIRKTPSLKLFHGTQTIRGGVDLSQFASLSVLELKKIPTHLLVGLSTFSSQLKALICNRSISSLKELFGSSEEEPILTTMWAELKELNVSYNYLEELDDTLKIMPNVEIFDASRNSLKHLDELLMLDKLIVLNLSYNNLDHLPILSCSSSSSLKVLFIRNNNLEDLAGLENLINLEELDVSYNCLSEFRVLKPLEKLKTLKSLQLDNNPFCLYKRHREIILKYLHPRALSVGLCLDGVVLSPREIKLMSTSSFRSSCSGPISGHQTSINVIVEDIANVTARCDQHYKLLRNAFVNNENSVDCVLEETKSIASSLGENTDEDGIIIRKTVRKKSRKKQREAVILDPNCQHEKSPVHVALKPAEEVLSHIQTKQLLEKRRKEYGTEWLLPSHSFQALLPDLRVPDVPSNTPMSFVTKDFSFSQHKADLTTKLSTATMVLPPEINVDESPQIILPNEVSGISQNQLPVDWNTDKTDCTKTSIINIVEGNRKDSAASDDIQVLSPHLTDETLFGTTDLNVEEHQEIAVYTWSENPKDHDAFENDVFRDHESEEESEDRIFILERKEKDRIFPLFVSIAGNCIKEKDFGTGKICDLLDLKNLLSVNLSTSLEVNIVKHEIHLSFDCLKASKQKRLYISDNEEAAKHMVFLLQPFADAKALEDTTVGAFECLKCSSQFSKQVADRKILKTKKPYKGQELLSSSYDSSKGYIQETEICPNCGSNLIVEMDSIPIPSMQLPVKKQVTSTHKNYNVEKIQKKDPPPCSSLPGSPLAENQFSKTSFSVQNEKVQRITPIVGYNGLGSTKSLNDSKMSNKDTNSSGQGFFVKIRSDSDSALVHQMRRNSSDITILSNASQNSVPTMSCDSCELTLHPIPEKDSLCSPTSFSPSHSEVEKNKLLPTDYDAGTNCGEPVFTFGHVHPPITKIPVQLFDSSFEPSHQQINESEQMSPLLSKKSSSQDCSDSFQDCVESLEKNSFSVPSNEHTNKSLRLIDLLSNKEIVNYENFSSIDHRLKLHFEFSVFGKDEMLIACLEASIVPQATCEEFHGFYVISNKKIYIMKLLREIDEDVGKCVHQLHSWSLDKLKVVSLLLGSQGFTTTCGTDNKIHTFLVRDADYCNCFISYLTDIIRQYLRGNHIPRFESSPKESLNQLNKEVIFSPSETDLEIVLYLLVFWTNNAKNRSATLPVAIIVTQNEFFVSRLQFEKLTSKQSKEKLFYYMPLEKQKISNLVEIQISENLKEAEFHFLDEDHNRICQWYIVTQSKSSLFSLINSFKNLWEEIFGIELPLCPQN